MSETEADAKADNDNEPGAMLTVGAAYATPARQVWVEVTVPKGTTVREVIERSGLLEQFPEVDLDSQKVGIFGKVAKPDQAVEAGDRVEIYRPITADPKAVKRKRQDSDDEAEE